MKQEIITCGGANCFRESLMAKQKRGWRLVSGTVGCSVAAVVIEKRGKDEIEVIERWWCEVEKDD